MTVVLLLGELNSGLVIASTSCPMKTKHIVKTIKLKQLSNDGNAALLLLSRTSLPPMTIINFIPINIPSGFCTFLRWVINKPDSV